MLSIFLVVLEAVHYEKANPEQASSEKQPRCHAALIELDGAHADCDEAAASQQHRCLDRTEKHVGVTARGRKPLGMKDAADRVAREQHAEE